MMCECESVTIKKRRVMISQPMNGKSDEEILATRSKAVEYLESQGYEVLNTLFTDTDKSMEDRGVVHKGLYFLARSLEVMSKCDAVYLCEGSLSANARGCSIENIAASVYGVEILYETV